jgi:HD superfamily phosphohydrolase
MSTRQGNLLKSSNPKHGSAAQGEGNMPVQLNEDVAGELLTLVDVVRDPVHGDIQLTKLERCLVDSPEFQRLGNLKQLGMTYIAYPGAVHTRFLHSLGTLHVCSQLIATCNTNAETYSKLAPTSHPLPLKITNYTNLLARLCALMHDMAHVPFGHTFDKEAQIFKHDEWQDEFRVSKLRGNNDSGLTQRLRGFFSREYSNISTDVANTLLDDVFAVLKAKGEDEIVALPYPFVHDLVGNTVCADLIDYVKRDMYFGGLVEAFGDRFLKYLAVFPVLATEANQTKVSINRESNNKATSWIYKPQTEREEIGEAVFPARKTNDAIQTCRIVLMNYRYNERKNAIMKPDIFEEAIDLVRRRLSVAEKLYYHRTKMVASAMLADAAKEAKLKVETIWDMSDHEVLQYLTKSTSERARSLANKVFNRHLFKPIYRVTYHTQDDSQQSKQIMATYTRFRDPEARANLMHRLEKYIDLVLADKSRAAIGSFTMSCPEQDMSVKGFDMLVIANPEDKKIRSLKYSDRRPTQLEIETITTLHAYLWRLEVFVDPDVLSLDGADSITRKLIGAIQQEIGCPNEIEQYSKCETVELAHLMSEAMLKADLKLLNKENIHNQFDELLEMSYRCGYESLEQEKRLDIIKDKLQADRSM